MRPTTLAVLAALTVGGLTACGKEVTGEEGHTPASAKLFDASGTELTPSVTLARGATTRVEVRFYADDGDLITGLEDEHSAGLELTPASLATVAAVSGQKFFFDLTTPDAAASGTVMVGFGHGTDTDEESFGPFTVTIP